MIDLVASLFVRYGPVRVYPYPSRLVGYEWTIETELDQTFRFLLDGKLGTPRIGSSTSVRITYLAGLFDAEGSLWLRGNRRFEPRMSFTNTDLGLLNWVRDTLDKMGFHPYLGLPNVDGVRQIQMWRVEEVLKLVRILPFRHPEKKAKVRLLLDSWKSRSELNEDWSELIAALQHDRLDFIRLASEKIKGKQAVGRS